ncbi:WYL domain-containing protein [Rhodococcus triatomae]|nr:WYL domain-containing protein [Rhodococcus triatomae]QNG19368.1 WYL domain-containing protein [Rhodococcus triatomae]QNG24719.1 WYL domain-containing protein [Rhodococcus triatomae]
MTATSSRMLALLSLLQTRRDWPGHVLSERLGVTTRTVRRDVDRLRELGYRIGAIKGPDGGYRLEAGSELPPLLFDDEQAIAIAIALRNAASSGVDIDDAAERALATVRQVMPSRLRHRIDGVRFVGTGSSVRADPAVLEAVSGAVRDRATLRFDYGDRSSVPRRTEPHGLVSRNGRWYLVAWDLERDDWRIYRVDRMRPRTPTGPRFEPREIPTRAAAAFVDARSKGSPDRDTWPCVGQFEISLPARDLVPWVHDGYVEEITERFSRVTAGSWSWTGLISYILRFDAPFCIIGPDELVDAADVAADRLRPAAERIREFDSGNDPDPG